MPKHYCHCDKARSAPNRKMGIVKTMKKHSKHHSKKHMKSMRRDMQKGMSFEEAHNKALKKVGK